MKRILTLLLILLAGGGALAQEIEERQLGPEEIVASDLSDDEKISRLNDLLRLNPRSADLYNDLGVIYAGREDWDLARDAFVSAIQCNPRLPAGHRNLGLVMMRQGMPEMAESEIRAYMRLSPDGGRDGWRTLADIKQSLNDPTGAAEAYRGGIEAFGSGFNPESADLVMGLANLYEQTGDAAALRAHLEQHLKGAQAVLEAQGWQPTDRSGEAARALVSGLLRLQLDDARRLEETGQKAAAAAAYEKAMLTDPTRDDLLPKAATAWLESGDAMRAKVMAKRATREHPDRAGGWRAMGQIAEVENRPREAVESFTRAWEIDPTQNDVAAKIGTIYLKLGDNEGARRFMGQVASDPATPPEILLNYALSLQRSGDHSLAVAPFKRLVERQPTNISAWKGLATSLRALERWREAGDAYKGVFYLEEDPRDAFQEGFCLAKQERFTEAAEAYARALALEPTYDKALFNRGVVLLRAGDDEGALEMFTALGAVEPDSYRVHFNSGVCLFNLERYDEALTAYEKALEIEETAGVWTNMGHVFDRLGEKTESAACFKEAARLQGKS